MVTKSLNKNLHRANAAKKDEFYTQLVDIENELKHYKEQFYEKIVYCNCDDPFESNFFKYFAANFNALRLKKLIATSYVPSPIAWTQLTLPGIGEPAKKRKNISRSAQNGETKAWKIEISEVVDEDLNGAIDLDDVAAQLIANKKNELAPLKGRGDFRSTECTELLEQADIIVTNPPFSLFREYVAQLMEHEKKFLILGQQGAIIYKEFFPLIKDNKVWLGYDNGGTKWFQVPMDYDIPTESRKKVVNGIKYFSMGSVNWYTNLFVSNRHNKFTLYKSYSPEDYPKYDNYDAINVNRYIDIPKDYDGIMGVPITFLDKHNPEQFEIIGLDRYTGKNGDKDFTINGKLLFRRLLIRKRK